MSELVAARTPLTAEVVIEPFVRWFGEDGRMELGQAKEIATAVDDLRPVPR